MRHCFPFLTTPARAWRGRFGKLLLGLMLTVATWSHSAPVFTQSTITASPEAPVEGEKVRFTVTIMNSGDAPADPALLKIEAPPMGYLLDVHGLDGATVDAETRTVEGPVTLLPGATKVIEVDVLAPRKSGGLALSLSLRLAHYASNTEHWDHKTVTINTRIPANGYHVGGMRIAPAGVAVLAWLGVFALLWAVVRPRSAVVAMMIATGFWLIFAVMAWRDYQVLTAWPKTTATVLGRKILTDTVTSDSADPQNRTKEVFTPEFALRYEVQGRTVISTGYDTGSSLHIGGRVRREEEMRDWKAGAQIPCWYDPAAPTDVVVRPGFGGAYLFALFPLPVFAIGVALMRRRKASSP